MKRKADEDRQPKISWFWLDSPYIHIIKLISRVDDFVSVLRLQMTEIKLHFVVFFLFIEWSENVDKIEIIEKT